MVTLFLNGKGYFRKVCCFEKSQMPDFSPHNAGFIDLFEEQLFSKDDNMLIGC